MREAVPDFGREHFDSPVEHHLTNRLGCNEYVLSRSL